MEQSCQATGHQDTGGCTDTQPRTGQTVATGATILTGLVAPGSRGALLGSPTVVQILEQTGLDVLADQIGVVPTLILGGAVMITAIILIGGGKAWIDRARQETRSQIAGRLKQEIDTEEDDSEVIQKANEEDNEVLTEATQRLERRGENITGENLTEILNEIQSEQANNEDSPTGLLDEPGDRAPTAKMSVAPDDIDEYEDHIVVNPNTENTFYARTLIISSYPDRVSYGWLDKLFTSGLDTSGADVRTTYHIWPRDPETMMSTLNQRATRLTSTIRRKQRDGKINTMEDEKQREKVNRLRDQLSQGSTKIFDFALYIQVIGDSKEAIDTGSEEAKQILAQSNARVSPFIDRQLDAFQSGLPVGEDRIRQTQIMDLKSLGTTLPFIEPTRVQSSGVLFGFHQTTSSPVIIDRFEMSGHNALVSGKIGSGKSYLSKLVMWRRLMMDPETELMIIDPVGGFGDMVNALDGQVITIDKDTIINPLEITKPEQTVGSMDEDPYDMKIRSVMGMLETHFSGNRSLSKGEEGVLRRAIRYAYLEKGITKDPRTHSNQSPTMQDVLDILGHISDKKPASEFLDVDTELENYVGVVGDDGGRSQSSRKNQDREAGYAHEVRLGLEEFSQGGQRSNLNGQTSIDMDARVVQFNLENVVDGGDSAGLIMHIMLDYLFQRTKSTTTRSLVTIDEAHYMLGSKGATNVLNTFIRHSRHYSSGVTLISQTVDEFMQGKAKEIYDQCDIRVLMRHEDIGQEAMEALDLGTPERNFVLGAQAGNTADYSEALVMTSNNGNRRIRVFSNEMEHHVVEGGSDDVWSLLYDEGTVSWEMIPDQKQPVVRRECDVKPSAGAD